MDESVVPLLARWANFYVITGSAAAALTGLQFVVVVLGAQMNRGDVDANSAFGTPTVVHFSSVLLIAAILTAPWLSLLPISLIFGLCGIIGILYGLLSIRVARRQRAYRPVLEDWVWHFTLPPLAYTILLIAAIGLQRDPIIALFGVAATVLLLLFVGIHNAWDSATFIAIHLRSRETKPADESEVPPAA